VLARLLVGGVAWLVAVILFAALLQWSGSPSVQLGSGRDGVSALARALNQLRPGPHAEFSWTVTRATSALRALVIEVDALNPTDAQLIAECLVVGMGAQYDEVLVYVRARNTTRDPLVRRIVWTPRAGYRVSAF